MSAAFDKACEAVDGARALHECVVALGAEVDGPDELLTAMESLEVATHHAWADAVVVLMGIGREER